jgi:2-keto-3-deoxy-L-rhamnonate aldolase RhmA
LPLRSCSDRSLLRQLKAVAALAAEPVVREEAPAAQAQEPVLDRAVELEAAQVRDRGAAATLRQQRAAKVPRAVLDPPTLVRP